MLKQSLLIAFFTVLFGIVVLYLFPWDKIKIGNNPLFPRSTITVTGEAQGEQKNQIATYNVSVTSSNDDKTIATNDTNTKMTNIINAVKAMGIPDGDIKTQNINVYQQPTNYPLPLGVNYPVKGGTGSGKWVATNSIVITLRDISKASSLSDLLNKSDGATVYGPNYTVDNTTNKEADILGAAIDAARKKAEKIASASGRTLGKAITISEGNQYGGIVPLMEGRAMGVGGAPSTPVQPGTQPIYKTVTVTFELK